MSTVDGEYMSDNRTICPRHNIPHVGFGCPMCGAEARRAMAMADEDNARRAFIRDAAMRIHAGFGSWRPTDMTIAELSVREATKLWNALQESEKK